MLDQKHIYSCVAAISKDLADCGTKLDSWDYAFITSRILQVLGLAYQEGMRDAFLKMGSYLKT